jgi:hypothetical protein
MLECWGGPEDGLRMLVPLDVTLKRELEIVGPTDITRRHVYRIASRPDGEPLYIYEGCCIRPAGRA